MSIRNEKVASKMPLFHFINVPSSGKGIHRWHYKKFHWVCFHHKYTN